MTPEELAVHEGFMRRALELAERGRWSTAPNPTVGAVLVKDGAVAAEGWHQVCGQAHAEVNCLRDAASKGVDPRGGTLYVTLEPCNHFGKTPPCSHAVLEAGISRVVIGMLDPNAKAAGGADFLREHGVEVVSGVLEQECRDLVADFLVWQTTRRPYVILKMASTLDGRISTQGGSCQKITNDASHAVVQRLREGACVSTSQPAPGALMDCWEGLLERYEEIVYLPMSSGLSGGCQTAAMLAAEYGGSVHVVDNHRISVTLRQSVLEAKHLASQGKQPRKSPRIWSRTDWKPVSMWQ